MSELLHSVWNRPRTCYSIGVFEELISSVRALASVLLGMNTVLLQRLIQKGSDISHWYWEAISTSMKWLELAQ